MRIASSWVHGTLLLLCVVLYWPGLEGALLFDSTAVLGSEGELHLDPSEFIQWRNAALSSNSGPGGRPVSMLTFALNYAIFGAVWPFGFKLFNLAIHCVIALLSFQLLRRLLCASTAINLPERQAYWVATTAAALWLLHPLHVSSVLYAVQRMEQLSALFTLLGLSAYLHYRPGWLQRGATASELSNCVLLVFLCTALAVLAKEDGILLLPLLVLVELLFFRCEYKGEEIRFLKRLCAAGLYLPLALVIGLWLLQPGWLIDTYAGRQFTLSERLLTELRVLWQYLGWFFVPDIRAMGLHHDTIAISTNLLQPLSTLLALMAWVLLLLGSALAWRRWPLFAFALGWYLIAHLAEATVVALEFAYEHRNYLAVLGPCLLVSWGIWCGLPSLTQRQRGALASLLLLILALQLGTRASLWGDEEQLAGYHVYHHPDSLRSVYHYANTQLRLGEETMDPDVAGRRLTLSRQYYEDMLRLDSGNFPALATLLYLDSRYFSSLASERWIGELREGSHTREMRRDDVAALGLLLECLMSNWCDMPGQSYEQMLLQLSGRYPENPIYLDLLARYSGEVAKNYAQAIHYHSQLLSAHPEYLQAYVGLIAWHNRSGNREQMLENLGKLLQRDSSPTRVQRIKRNFEPSAS